MKEKMRYKFKVYEEGKEVEDKEAMSYKKLLKSLVNAKEIELLKVQIDEIKVSTSNPLTN